MGDTTDTSELGRIVARLAAGDAAFVVTFATRYGATVARAAIAAGIAPGDADPTVHDVAYALLGRAPEVARAAWDVVLDALAEVVDGSTRGFEPVASALAPRTLHLVDIENLAGGPEQVDRWFQPSLRQYRATAAPRLADHVVLAADRTVYARTAWDVDRGWSYRFGVGPDGADRALLDAAEPAWVAGRFDRVVVGSGDHAFAPLVVDLLGRGLEVVVVSRPRNLSGRLRRSGAQLITLPDLPALTLAA